MSDLSTLFDQLEQVTAEIRVQMDQLQARFQSLVGEIRTEYEGIAGHFEHAVDVLEARSQPPKLVPGRPTGLAARLREYIAEHGPLTVQEARDLLERDHIPHSFSGVGVAIANRRYFERLQRSPGEKLSRYALAETVPVDRRSLRRSTGRRSVSAKETKATRPTEPWRP